MFGDIENIGERSLDRESCRGALCQFGRCEMKILQVKSLTVSIDLSIAGTLSFSYL
jgi:hypothetical protein